MYYGFDSWNSNELEHHGIPGMKWGVRKYQNEDGSLTVAGKARYGYGNGEGTKRTSAKRMQKDFNRLDASYANVVANQREYARRTAKLSRKMHKAEQKGKTEKAQNLQKKALKNAQRAALDNKRLKEIEKLQWKIIGKAATNGYTTRSKEVIRMANSGRQKAKAYMAATVVGGGALTRAIAGGILRKKAIKVSGQKVNISKRGPGGTQVVNYSGYKKQAEQLRKEEEARKRFNYHNR